jgi:hypothetical protein
MDVYLVPTGPGHYDLYCESAEEPVTHPVDGSGGIWKRLQDKFSAVLAAVEREQERGHPAPTADPPPAGLMSRLRVRGVRWLAERIAEQRLLWRLRGQTEVRAFFPAHIDSPRALAIIREGLSTDADRHRRWLIVDTVGLLFSLLLTPLPGPNLPGYYFTFRVVGHFLAVRGARHGLRTVTWDLHSSTLLDELAGLEHLSTADRSSRVRAIAGQLGLAHLARFFERTAVETA